MEPIEEAEGWSALVDIALKDAGCVTLNDYVLASALPAPRLLKTKAKKVNSIDASRSAVSQLHEFAPHLRPIYTSRSLQLSAGPNRLRHFVTLCLDGRTWTDADGQTSIKKGREIVSALALEELVTTGALS